VRFRPRSGTSGDDPVAVLLPEPLRSEDRALLADHEYVEAVRRVRRRTHLRLRPAALAVDAVRDPERRPPRTGTRPLAGTGRYREAWRR
jgi:hypothetical protein